MEYCFLGNTGIEVSSLCMGTMTFGREADQAASKDIFNRCRDVSKIDISRAGIAHVVYTLFVHNSFGCFSPYEAIILKVKLIRGSVIRFDFGSWCCQ